MSQTNTSRGLGFYVVLILLFVMLMSYRLMPTYSTTWMADPLPSPAKPVNISPDRTTNISTKQLNSSNTPQEEYCILEKLDPWDKSLGEDLNLPPIRFNCSNKAQLVYVDDYGVLKFNDAALELYQLDRKHLRCTTSALIRLLGDQNVSFESEMVVSLPTFVKSHFFRVTCSKNDATVIYDYLHFNPFWNNNAKPRQMISTEGPSRLSLVVFGLDSVSRSHAIRFLPKSYKVLLEEFQAYDFEGYSRVGENTFPNFVPFLTGKKHREFPLVGDGKVPADTMPFIWNKKTMAHIATLYAEDTPSMSTFNYEKPGFVHPPVDYYFRPYTLGMTHFIPKLIDEMKNTDAFCYGANSKFDIQVQYLKGFLSMYHGKRKFAFFFNNRLSHNSFSTLRQGDDSFVDFLHWIRKTDQLQNTFFLTLSDHGLRFDQGTETSVGRKEKNRPWFMLHVPKYLLQEYSWLHETLLENSKKLVTHYDIYQTMLDIINDNAFVHRSGIDVQTHLVRRNVFFPIPSHRTCADAGIEKPYCACEVRHTISSDTGLVKSMAELLVGGINDMLLEQQQFCHTLYLSNINEAQMIYSKNATKHLKKENAIDSVAVSGRYFILFHTKPGNAYFEGTVDLTQDSMNISNPHMVVVGEPARLDRYGNQSYCVNNTLLKLYCYCKTLV